MEKSNPNKLVTPTHLPTTNYQLVKGGNLPTYHGLSDAVVTERQREFGPNILNQGRPKATAWAIFLRQLPNPLLALLALAAGVSWYLSEYLDAAVIAGAIVLNILLGFLQEFKAERTLEALKKLVTANAWVLRNGKRQKIDAESLVPGDILLLSAGDKVAADGKILEASDLKVNEAPLTGESFGVAKTNRATVFAGTTVLRGSGVIEVTTIGAGTKMGQIAHLVAVTEEEITPLEERLSRLANQLSLVLSSVAGLLFILAIAQGRDLETAIVATIALAVAVIPEGLPIMVTLMLAAGMERLARSQATLRRLSAVETLGSVTTIAVDKTGTITTGKLAVAELVGEDPETILSVAILASDIGLSLAANPDPLEVALNDEADRLNLSVSLIHKHHPRLASIPFDASRRFMAALVHPATKSPFLAIKGAPEVILAQTRLTPTEKRKVETKINQLTAKGYRVLAIGQAKVHKLTNKHLPKQLEYLGLISFADPLRSDARQAAADLQEAGIRLVMMTGDHPNTARTIAAQLGLPAAPKNLMTGDEVRSLSAQELTKRLHTTTIFARLLPEEKLVIVEALQKQGEIVAMTGDGVNDGPALKRANIGVAMGQSGTEVAKETADLILLDDRLTTIVAAVAEGRTMVENLRKGLLYLLGTNAAELFLILGATLLGWPLPLTATQILWVNLVTDTLPVAGLAFERSPQTLASKPTSTKTALLDPFLLRRTLVMGAAIAISGLIIFYVIYAATANLALAQTAAFSALAVIQLANVFTVRSLHELRWPWELANPLLAAAISIAIGLQLLALYVIPNILKIEPLNGGHWLSLGALGLGVLAVVELHKKLERSL